MLFDIKKLRKEYLQRMNNSVTTSVRVDGKWNRHPGMACMSHFRGNKTKDGKHRKKSGIHSFMAFRLERNDFVIDGVGVSVEHKILSTDYPDAFINYICSCPQYGGIPEYDKASQTLYFNQDVDVHLLVSASRAFINIREYPSQCILFANLVNDGVDPDVAYIFALAHDYNIGNDVWTSKLYNSNHAAVNCLRKDKEKLKESVDYWRSREPASEHPVSEYGYTYICDYIFPDQDTSFRLNLTSYDDILAWALSLS